MRGFITVCLCAFQEGASSHVCESCVRGELIATLHIQLTTSAAEPEAESKTEFCPGSVPLTCKIGCEDPTCEAGQFTVSSAKAYVTLMPMRHVRL